MKSIRYTLTALAGLLVIMTASAFAGQAAHNAHDAQAKDSDRIGTLFHESEKEGYMLSYYLMDLREQKSEPAAAAHSSHGAAASTDKEMKKPHHIMVYIMDKDHKVVEKAKVGLVIKGGEKAEQKIMAMYMSKGFGLTADMKAKGTYTIMTKVMVDGKTLMDKFDHEIK